MKEDTNGVRRKCDGEKSGTEEVVAEAKVPREEAWRGVQAT